MFSPLKIFQLNNAAIFRSFHTARILFAPAIKEGAALPAGTLLENDPKTKVNVQELFAGKKGGRKTEMSVFSSSIFPS